MPNHVKNCITLEGDADRIQQMLAQIQNDEFGLGTISFHKIIPMPESVYAGELGQKELALHGQNNWHDWRVANWDTKWDAYGYESGIDYSKSETLTFLTAWSAPHAVIEKLAELFPDVKFTHEWADENIGFNCGRYVYKDGKFSEMYYPESEEQSIEFAVGIWNLSLKELTESEEESEEIVQSAM